MNLITKHSYVVPYLLYWYPSHQRLSVYLYHYVSVSEREGHKLEVLLLAGGCKFKLEISICSSMCFNI